MKENNPGVKIVRTKKVVILVSVEGFKWAYLGSEAAKKVLPGPKYCLNIIVGAG